MVPKITTSRNIKHCWTEETFWKSRSLLRCFCTDVYKCTDDSTDKLPFILLCLDMNRCCSTSIANIHFSITEPERYQSLSTSPDSKILSFLSSSLLRNDRQCHYKAQWLNPAPLAANAFLKAYLVSLKCWTVSAKFHPISAPKRW